jgi:sugar lactone lactonase YvrE
MDGFEKYDDRFRAMALPNAPLETLGQGFRWLEGPVWFADHDWSASHTLMAIYTNVRGAARP